MTKLVAAVSERLEQGWWNIEGDIKRKKASPFYLLRIHIDFFRVQVIINIHCRYRIHGLAVAMPFDWGCCGDKNGRNAADAAAAPPRPVNLLSPSTSSSSHSVSKPSQIKRSPFQTTVPPQQASLVAVKKDDLWKRAEEQLDEESRKRLRLSQDGNSPSIDGVLAEIIKEISAKYEDYQNGKLSIRNRDASNRKVDVRGSAKKVLVCALQAQDLIKAVAGFDPTGYASIAWSVVAFGLTLIKNDIDRRDAIMDASEFLAKALAYHSIIEHNYRKGTIASSARLDDALVEVYVALLRYIAEVQTARHESAIARVGKSITALIDQPLDRLKSVVEQKSAVVDQWKMIVRDEDQSRRAEDILVRIDEMARRVHSIDVRTNDQEERSILDWISTFSYSNIQNETKKARSPDTGTWFVQSSDRYQRWKTTPGQLLWMHGPVGCGKSVLCSTIIADTDLHCQQNEPCVLAYWYFKFSDNETQGMESMIRSFIRQLCPRPIPSPIRKIWEDHRRNREPDLDVLLTILRDIMGLLPGDVFIIFDALDECPVETRERRLLAFMDDLIRDFPTKVHLLATSRPEPDIHNALTQHTLFGLEDALSGDVEKFVQERLTSGKLRRWNRSILERIEHQLLNVSERQIKRLERCHIPQDIDEALTTIPDTLEATYKGILEQEILPRYRDAVRSIFTWLTFSMKPLSQEAVAEVAGFPSSDSVIEICTTQMVTLNTADGTIRLAHFSVKEFLLSEQSTHWCHLSEMLGHRTILSQILSRILAEKIELTYDVAVRKPLLLYGSKNWPDHFRQLDSLTPDSIPEIYLMLLELFTERVVYLNWHRLTGMGYSHFNSFMVSDWPRPTDKAIAMQFETLVELLLELRFDSMGFPLQSRESLLAVAARSSINTLVLLLKRAIAVPFLEVEEIIRELRPRSEKDRATLSLVLDLLWNMGALYGGEESERIHPAILLSMAKNPICADVLLDICFERGGQSTTPVTAELVQAAFDNVDLRVSILKVLLQRRKEEVHFTQGIMRQVAELSQFNSELASLVLNNNSQIACLLPEHAETFARGASSEVLKLVFEVYGENFMSQRNVLLAASVNPGARDLIRLLLSGKELNASLRHELILAAATEWKIEGLEFLRFVLDLWGPQTEIDQDIMIAAVTNTFRGIAILEAFLERQQAGFAVSEKVLFEAASRNTKEVMQLLMNNGGSEITICQELLFAAANNRDYGLSVLRVLLLFVGPDYEIPLNLLEAAAGNPAKSNGDDFQAIIEMFKGAQVPDSVFMAAYNRPDHMRVLLDRNGNSVPVKDLIMAMSNCWTLGTLSTFQLLLKHDILVVDEWVLEQTVARNHNCLWDMIRHVPQFPINEKVITAIKYESGVRLILRHAVEKSLLTEEMIKVAIKSTLLETPWLKRFLVEANLKAPLRNSVLTLAGGRDPELPLLLSQP
ncbi:uncharacterized protein BO72DRAFT_459535 [Aspergillus fijiensis CBS 313.89]|uniref:NACHT domain-containing protein n=1 Tax=Aspergillus fijiensis CBS 313.89 TaxID=1448319 RepID=A0A8G1RPU5_9EURO|nr:uncharacterized protein BO72DRAFT_459535 [Aspergillus fijiensis CBS 313.89]RAK76573.1 hypothetical protein BO72DRAFT_459535 [Aspergillus fijiensis CBS 313.89]